MSLLTKTKISSQENKLRNKKAKLVHKKMKLETRMQHYLRSIENKT